MTEIMMSRHRIGMSPTLKHYGMNTEPLKHLMAVHHKFGPHVAMGGRMLCEAYPSHALVHHGHHGHHAKSEPKSKPAGRGGKISIDGPKRKTIRDTNARLFANLNVN